MVVAGRRNPPRSGGPAAGRLAAGTRRLVPGALRRDPQDRWAAVFGRIAGYSFAVAVVSGVLLLPVPVIGTHLVFAIFGGAPPGHEIIGRDYWVHILVLPALAGALLLASFRLPLRWPRRVRLDPLLPFTCAVLVLLGTIAQINPVWIYGPYQPGSITAGAVPDWYMGLLDGALRLMPVWDL